MFDFGGSIVVDRPVADVFSFVADPANIPRYQAKVLSTRVVSAGPLGAGTRFEETLDTGAGRMTVACEVAAWDDPRRVAFVADGGFVHCEAEYTFEPVPGGTRVRIDGRAQLRGWRRVMEPMMRGQVRRSVPEELALIRRRLTEAAPVGGRAAVAT